MLAAVTKQPIFNRDGEGERQKQGPVVLPMLFPPASLAH